MNKLSGLKDTDREILKYMDDDELLKVCSIDKRFWYEICDDNFLRRRLAKYSSIEEHKRDGETWKIFFSRFMYYVKDMKKSHGFAYDIGDFKKQYIWLKVYCYNTILMLAAEEGEFALVKYSIKNGGAVNVNYDNPLRFASRNGHLHIVKYLVEHGANVKKHGSEAIKEAMENEHIEIVKYLKSLN